MNNKLKNILKIIDELYPSSNESLSNVWNQTKARISQLDADLKRKRREERIKRAESGDFSQTGIVDKSLSSVNQATISGVKTGVEKVGGGTLGDIALATMGLPPGTASKFAGLINKGIDALNKEKKLTPDQEKKEVEKQLDKIRQQDGEKFYVSYVVTKKDPSTRTEEPPELEVWNSPIKALSNSDVEAVFKKLMIKYVKDNPSLYGSEFKIKDISEQPIVLPPKKDYNLAYEFEYEDGRPGNVTRVVKARSKDEAYKKKDYVFSKYVSTNPDRFFGSKVKKVKVSEA